MNIRVKNPGMNSAEHRTDKEQQLMEQLKEILLREDRDEILELRNILENREQLDKRVSPIVEDHISFLKKHFPEEYKKAVDQQISEKLKHSQDEILAVLYPAMGQMIKKYIALQFELLRESIDHQIQSQIRKGPMGWVRRKILGLRESDWVLNQVGGPKIEEIFVIQRDSGILLGSASVSTLMDQDLVAGMLTAIKAFAEDAFQRGVKNLQLIEYDTFSILLQTFPQYYIAMALTGPLTAADRDQLTSDLFVFDQKELQSVLKRGENEIHFLIKERLERYFLKPQNLKLKTG